MNPLEKKPLKINSGNIETSRQLKQARALLILYSSQISYGSTPISKKLLDNPNQLNPNLAIPEISSSLVQFTSIYVAQSHIHIVQILRILESNMNNKGDDKPNILKQAMHYSD